MMGLPMSVYKIQFPPGQIKLNKPPHLHGMLAPANTGDDKCLQHDDYFLWVN